MINLRNRLSSFRNYFRDSKELYAIKKTFWKEINSLSLFFISETTWCNHNMSQDSEGNELFNPYDERATKFCLYGACLKLNLSYTTILFIEHCAKINNFKDMIQINDKGDFVNMRMFLNAVVYSASLQ